METSIEIESHIFDLDNASYDLRTISDKLGKGELNDEWKEILKHLRKANKAVDESRHLTRLLYRELGAISRLVELPGKNSAHELLKEVTLLRKQVKLHEEYKKEIADGAR